MHHLIQFKPPILQPNPEFKGLSIIPRFKFRKEGIYKYGGKEIILTNFCFYLYDIRGEAMS